MLVHVEAQALQLIDATSELTGRQGRSLPFSYTLENASPEDTTYVFESAYADGLGISVTLDDNLYERPLAAGTQETVNGKVNLGDNTPTGDLLIDVTLREVTP